MHDTSRTPSRVEQSTPPLEGWDGPEVGGGIMQPPPDSASGQHAVPCSKLAGIGKLTALQTCHRIHAFVGVALPPEYATDAFIISVT